MWLVNFLSLHDGNPGLVHSKCAFSFFRTQPETPWRVSFLWAWVLFFVRMITFSKNLQFWPRVEGFEESRVWRWEGKLTKGQFILLTLIKSYVPSCSIFQLFEITFLLLFVFFRFFGFYVYFQEPLEKHFRVKINNISSCKQQSSSCHKKFEHFLRDENRENNSVRPL